MNLVVLSGGLDSTVCMGLAAAEGEVLALSFDYGQRHRVELDRAAEVAGWYRAEQLVVRLDASQWGGSALTDPGIEVPDYAGSGLAAAAGLGLGSGAAAGLGSTSGSGAVVAAGLGSGAAAGLGSTSGSGAVVAAGGGSGAAAGSAAGSGAAAIPVTYVPGRNLIFLAVAVGVAEARDADSVYLGVNALDYSGYPDCRPEFVRSFEQTAALALKRGVEGRPVAIRTPLQALTKADIVRLGRSIGAPLHLSWSCYRGDPSPCGRCDACALRARGFAEAGVADPALP